MKKKTRIFGALLSGILLLAGCASSSEDLNTTNRVQNFLSQMNVTLIDHFIIGEGRFSSVQKEIYYSIAELIKDKIKMVEQRSK